MPAVLASNAAASRNARKRRKNADREDSRTKERIKYEREGYRDDFGIEGMGITGAQVPMDTTMAPPPALHASQCEDTDLIAEEIAELDWFGRIAHKCDDLTHDSSFNLFIVAVIVIAGILVGMQTYKELEDSTVLAWIDQFILAVFCIEVIVKVVKENRQPWRFFIGSEWKWNCFDFAIVFLSMPFLDWGNSVGLLRLLRLMRLVKLVKKIPQLYMIVMGLIGGMKAIMYILILMLLIFYLYAIVGWYLFMPNDSFHFQNLGFGMLTLWRISTFEDWTDILYINYYGCSSGEFDSGIYTSSERESRETGLIFCPPENAKVYPVLAIIYFVSFVFISALVMLSLFVGAVTMSMTDSMEQLKAEKENAYRERTLERAREQAQRATAGSQGSEVVSPKRWGLRTSAPSIMAVKRAASAFGKGRSSMVEVMPANGGTLLDEDSGSGFDPTSALADQVAADDAAAESEARNHVGEPKRLPSRRNFFRTESEANFGSVETRRLRRLILRWLSDSVAGVNINYSEEESRLVRPGWRGKFACFSQRCDRLSTSTGFIKLITLMIVVAGALVGLTTFSPGPMVLQVVDICDYVVLFIFFFETLIRTIAHEFQPWRFFRNHDRWEWWNIFDYIVVIGSLVPGGGGTITILKLLRLLRVLKLLKALPELQIIVVALIKGVGSITYIAAILFLVFYMFAILGMILFERNDPWHFGSLHMSLFTLFRCATLEDWTDVMYINMYGCDQSGYERIEDLCVSPYASPFASMTFFVFFTIIGGLVLMTLFIGVVTTSMEEASNEQKEALETEERVLEIQKKTNLPDEKLEIVRSVFGLIDLDGGGTIDEEELAIGILTVGDMFSKEEIKVMVAQVDEDNSGEVDLAEFLQFMEIFKEAARLRVNPIEKAEVVEAAKTEVADKSLMERKKAAIRQMSRRILDRQASSSRRSGLALESPKTFDAVPSRKGSHHLVASNTLGDVTLHNIENT